MFSFLGRQVEFMHLVESGGPKIQTRKGIRIGIGIIHLLQHSRRRYSLLLLVTQLSNFPINNKKREKRKTLIT